MSKPSVFTLLFLALIRNMTVAQGATTGADIGCLETLRASISDPNGYLTSWNFTDTTPGFICMFNGIDCWNENENRVLSIRLSNMGLEGQFPSGLELCETLTALDISSNSFTGSIPENIADMVPYLTYLDLSYNSFSGEIPVNLSGCQYLNTLNLQDNKFTGNIPSELVSLTRLDTFNVSSNQLTGPIPAFSTQFSSDSYSDNSALCGSPLNSECSTGSKKRTPGVGMIVATALGAVTGFWIGIGIVLSFMVDCGDRVTPWFSCYIMFRKFTLYLLRTRDHRR